MASFGSVGLTVIVPADVHRSWWPQTVWRPITAPRHVAGTVLELNHLRRAAKIVTPPSVDFTTMIWESNSKGDLPSALVLAVEEVDVQRAVGRHLGDGELVLIAVPAGTGRLEACSSDGSQRSPSASDQVSPPSSE